MALECFLWYSSKDINANLVNLVYETIEFMRINLIDAYISFFTSLIEYWCDSNNMVHYEITPSNSFDDRSLHIHSHTPHSLKYVHLIKLQHYLSFSFL